MLRNESKWTSVMLDKLDHQAPKDISQTLKQGLLSLGLTSICLLLLWWLFSLAPGLEQGRQLGDITAGTHSGSFNLLANLEHPLGRFFLQILAIVTVSRIFGLLARRIGQPFVMGEILAGILLGPSLVGMLFPAFSAFVFPEASLQPLQLISQLGLIFFMFTIGLELDQELLKQKTRAAALISHISMLFPFVLGVGLAALLYRAFAPPSVNYVSFALFMGISMSITAFPVLASILQERKLSHTDYGALALTCAAIGDVSAWCVLAFVVAIVSASSPLSAVLTVGLSLTYILVMLLLIKPWMAHRLAGRSDLEGRLPSNVAAGILVFVLLSALITELIGIHALFGAFLAGAIMPVDRNFRHVFIERIEYISTLLLLPIFFTFTGLRTQIGLLSQPALWTTAAFVIATAILGKFGGSLLAARAARQSWATSLRVGILMNTRGLMELIVLNLGYDLGILSAEMFTMLVLMAVLTTFMTGPALGIVDRIVGDRPKTIS